jgi:hypothetical protein
MSRLFTWLAGLFGVFLMIFGLMTLGQTFYRYHELSDASTGSPPPGSYDGGESYVPSQWHGVALYLHHNQVIHLSVLLVLAGLLIVMLTYPRSSKPKK